MNVENNYVELFIRSFISFSDFRQLFLSNWSKEFCNTPSEKVVYLFLTNFYKKSQYFPKRKDLELEFINNKKYETIRKDLLELIDRIYSINLSDYTETFIKGVFLDKTRKLKVQTTVRKMIENIQKDGKVDVEKFKNKILDSLTIDDGEDDGIIDYFGMSVIERMNIINEMHKSHFKTGISSDLDDVLKLKRKTVVALSAQLGVGKSMFMTNLMANLTKEGFNSIYLSLEMDSFDVSKRLDKMIFDLEDEDYFKSPDIISDKMDKYIQDNKKLGDLYIKSFPPRSLAGFQLKQLLEKFKSKNKIMDVVFVDYLTLMRPNYLTKDMNSYDKGKAIAEELQTIAKEHNCLVFTVLQVNREAYGKTHQGSDNIAESIAIPQQLDTLINMTEYVDEVDDQKFYIISFEKTRDSKKTKKKVYLKLTDTLKIIEVSDEEREMLMEKVSKKKSSKGSFPKPESFIDIDL